MTNRPVLIVTAVAGDLLDDARRAATACGDDAPVTFLVHWRAVHDLPPETPIVSASEYRAAPLTLVRRLRALAPITTLIVCDGQPGATVVKLLGLAAGGRRLILRPERQPYRLGRDIGDTVAHATWLVPRAIGRVARAVGAVVGIPVLTWAAWRWRRT